ncbi:MAG: Gfo/Idh/MocA family oxidoreductase [Kiritimatiellae bacterium]|nr:Gfo/Idh/MocA family oxidoreductase [Kiritimatiellia bacterium]
MNANNGLDRGHVGVTRRGFLRRATTLVMPMVVPPTVLGREGVAPSGRLGVALIACGGRAGYGGRYAENPHSRIVAVCDPVRERREQFSRRFGGCPAVNDFREVLANPAVDAVHIATPDHWHVPIALMAAKAGKHMYIEKPLGLCAAQTLAARVIVDRYGRIVQYGAQQRSIQHVRMGIELVLNGHIGRVTELYAWAPRGESGGRAEPVLPVPEGFDYDLWLGPAPLAPFCEDRCFGQGQRKGVYHIYDYAIGFLAGWGAHPMDMLQWWADNAKRAEVPVRYEGTGTVPTQGLFNTVTHWDVTATYADGLRLRFMDNETAARLRPHPGIQGGHGTLFVGETGWVRVSRDGWATSPESLVYKGKDPGERRLAVSRDQIDNFIESVLAGRQPIDDLHSAVRSDLACHLAEIAVRTGRPVQWDPVRETIVGDEQAVRRLTRPAREPWSLETILKG